MPVMALMVTSYDKEKKNRYCLNNYNDDGGDDDDESVFCFLSNQGEIMIYSKR